MRVALVVVLVAFLLPVAAFAADSSGQLGIGWGPEYGFAGLNYEGHGKRLTPTVGAGVSAANVGVNWYLTNAKKGDMPAGYRLQLIGGPVWNGGWNASLSIGSRFGNWDYGVGALWFSTDTNAVGVSADQGVTVAYSFGFRF